MANILMDKGFVPFVPLYCHFQHMAHPRPYADWIEIDKVWVLACDCVLRLTGKSIGADGEVELAKINNKPVFYSLDELCSYYEAYARLMSCVPVMTHDNCVNNSD